MKYEDFTKCVNITSKEFSNGCLLLAGEVHFDFRDIISVDEQMAPGEAETCLIEHMWKTIFGDIYDRLERLENGNSIRTK